MPNSYRIRTDLGINKSINVSIDQEFEYLEILSLKVLQSDIYTRVCSDYGVIIGRVSVNNGFGLPNVKVSVFIPLTEEDSLNSVISEIYPYQSISDVNEDGYRYNLLPYEPSYSNHVPTGTFFNRTDVLTNPTLIEVYDKYYKYNAVTNDSGDFMIFGVPVGTHKISIDVDLSDIGEFSLAPQDLIRMGIATQAQVNGTKFKKSTNLRELPQIINLVRTVVVEPLWGQSEVCNLGICRSDFDLSNESNINITPTSIFMGSLVSNIDGATLRTTCNSKWKLGGLCNLTVSPGEILAIRQTIKEDPMGRPALEVVDLEMGGVVIDDNGAWLIDVPMNLDYLVTNEFGEQVISDNPNKGIPTKGKYRFKVKWAQSPSLGESIRRGYYLVPNIKEYGWSSPANDPTQINGIGTQYAFKSYAFSLDWDDYGDTTPLGQHMIQEAINCEDKFYLMQYNKVYTVSQMIDKFRGGMFPDNFVGIKAISQDDCNTENYKFPTNDANFRFDIIYTLFNLLSVVIRSVVWILIIIVHVLYATIYLIWYVLLLIASYLAAFAVLYFIAAFSTYPPVWGLVGVGLAYAAASAIFYILANWFKRNVVDKCTPLQLPLILYPDCSMCDCSLQQGGVDGGAVTADLNSEVGAVDESQEHNGNCVGTGNVQLVKLSKGETYDKTLIGGGDDYYVQTVALLTGDVIPPQSNPKPVQNDVRINAPQYFQYGSNPYYNFTTSLTFSERMNLFNTKAKYFDESIPGFPNPGGGVNRVKVNFNPNNTDHHFDNVVAVLCSKQSLNKLLPGTLITFQNPKLTGDTRASEDINVDMYLSNTGATQNQFQNFAITGTTLPLTSFTVNYAHISGSGNTTTNYSGLTITASTDYHKFPIDIEYFQVLTGMTYSAYTNQCITQLPNSFNARYLSNKVRINHINNTSYCNFDPTTPPLYFNPISKIKNYNDLVVVFLVRGVDPYSPKVNVKYGLGRLFGHTNEDAVQVGGALSGDPKFHLNIPIQGGFKNTRQDMSTNTTLDTYATLNQNLYYNSYTYKPDPSLFKPFSSSLPRLYSSLDDLSMVFNGGACGGLTQNVANGAYQSTSGIRIDGNTNDYSNEWGNSKHITGAISPILGCEYFDYTNNNITGTTSNDRPLPFLSYTGVTRGYFPDEIIEGGGILIMNTNKNDIPTPYIPHNNSALPQYPINLRYYWTPTISLYLSPSYNEYNKMLFGLGTSGRQIIMRSDRLPTSTCVQWNKCPGLQDSTFSFPLFANENFYMDTMSSKGGVFTLGESSGSNPISTGGGTNSSIDAASYSSSVSSALIESFTCGKSVPLDCYKANGNTMTVSHGRCSYNFFGKSYFEGGCYLVGTVPLFSLLFDLFYVQPEWQSRLNINFAACRNVWSDSFANNWINGTLFAFPFKTSTYYDENNRAQSDHCKAPIIFHSQTKTFYYRSSPYKYSTNEFIGSNRPNPGGIWGYIPGASEFFIENDKNLKYPTTMMDLGPRTYYLQEIVMSDIYDGYVMDKLGSTSFNDVSEILNLHIISRMINKNFLDSLISIVIGENIIGKYFWSRYNKPNLKADADYAQMIGISSELGIAEFDSVNYPDPPAGSQPPIYFNGASAYSAIMGIFFSSNTQVRDFITPKRTIINDTVNMSNVCAFNNFGVYSQVVPFYKWRVSNHGPGNSIFGDSNDNWVTGPVNGPSFFSNQYQSLDRLQGNSGYFMGAQAGQPVKNFKGYIYAVDANGNINPNVNYWTNPEYVTVGAPFHFYFGLKKGKSSLDRFTQKWINTENIVN